MEVKLLTIITTHAESRNAADTYLSGKVAEGFRVAQVAVNMSERGDIVAALVLEREDSPDVEGETVPSTFKFVDPDDEAIELRYTRECNGTDGYLALNEEGNEACARLTPDTLREVIEFLQKQQ